MAINDKQKWEEVLDQYVQTVGDNITGLYAIPNLLFILDRIDQNDSFYPHEIRYSEKGSAFPLYYRGEKSDLPSSYQRIQLPCRALMPISSQKRATLIRKVLTDWKNKVKTIDIKTVYQLIKYTVENKTTLNSEEIISTFLKKTPTPKTSAEICWSICEKCLRNMGFYVPKNKPLVTQYIHLHIRLGFKWKNPRYVFLAACNQVDSNEDIDFLITNPCGDCTHTQELTDLIKQPSINSSIAVCLKSTGYEHCFDEDYEYKYKGIHNHDLIIVEDENGDDQIMLKERFDIIDGY